MSLTSRVTNLFSSGSYTSPEDRHRLGFADDEITGTKGPFTDVRSGTELSGSDTMASQAVEEEGRPPYLHVSLFGIYSETVTDEYSL